MIRRNDNYPDEFVDRWDGTEHRRHRRESDYGNENYNYQQPYVTIQPPVADQAGSGFKLFSSGTALSVCFSILTAVSGFVFGLYKQVTALEYKQETIFEKIDDSKQSITDIKLLIKESETNRQKLLEHISGIEETIMELYRNQKK
jgi:hypothetical protein